MENQRSVNRLFLFVTAIFLSGILLFFSSSSIEAASEDPTIVFDHLPTMVGDHGEVTVSGVKASDHLLTNPSEGLQLTEATRTPTVLTYRYEAKKSGTYQLFLGKSGAENPSNQPLISLTISTVKQQTSKTSENVTDSTHSTSEMKNLLSAQKDSASLGSSENTQSISATTQKKEAISETTTQSNSSVAASGAEHSAVPSDKKSESLEKREEKINRSPTVRGATIHQLTSEDKQKLGNLWDYNAYISGEHSANMADTEGAVAIRGNSVFPKDLQTFTYGASFRDPNTTIGEPIRPDQYVNVLIGGTIENRATNDWVKPVIENRQTNGYLQGWLVGRAPLSSWIYQNLGEWFSAAAYETDDETIQGAFTQLDTQLNTLTGKLDGLTSHLGQTVYEGNGYQLAVSSTDPQVLVATFKQNQSPLVVNTLTIPDKFLKGSEYKQILVTSDAEKVAMKGTSIAGATNEDGGLASKLTFYFPKAVSVTNFLEDNGNYPDTSLSGIDASGEDNYGKDNGTNYFHSFTIGSMIAPNATVVYHSGSINGYVFVKNLHQRDGMEIHNFYNPWLPEENVEKKGSILLHKEDKDSHQILKNAEFGIRKKGASDFLTVQSTDSNGELTFSDLAYGDYEILETKAPEGYQLDETIHSIHIDDKISAQTVTMENSKAKSVKGSVVLHKTDQADHKNLAGAVYGLRGLREHDFQKATTDEQGRIQFSDLTPGFYEVVELSAPDGYQLDKQSHIVKANISGKSQVIELTDEKVATKKGSILLRKIDAATGQPLSHAVFGVRALGERTFTTKKTDVSGQVQFEDLVPNTYYTVAEITAPEGYQRTPQPLVVKINDSAQQINLGDWTDQINTPTPVKGSIKIIKSDKQSGALLAGAEFGLRALGEKDYQKKKTDEKGEISFTGLTQGTYEIRELTPPAGYTNTSLVQKVMISGAQEQQHLTVHWQDEKTKEVLGSAKVIKLDDSGHPLAGAEFAIRKDHDRRFGTPVKTNANGEAYFNNLPLGKYEIIETKAPAGYQLNGKIYPVIVTGAEENAQGIATIINYKKPALTGQVLLEKRDKETNQLLAGVVFDLQDAKGKTLDTYKTNEQGQLFIEHLALGDYQLVETKALPGYELNSKPYKFTITEKNVAQLQFLSAVNQPIHPTTSTTESTTSLTTEPINQSTTESSKTDSTNQTTEKGRTTSKNTASSAKNDQKYPQTNDRFDLKNLIAGAVLVGSSVVVLWKRRN